MLWSETFSSKCYIIYGHGQGKTVANYGDIILQMLPPGTCILTSDAVCNL